MKSPCLSVSPVVVLRARELDVGLGISSLRCSNELHSEGSRSALQVMDLAFLVFVRVGSAAIDPSLSIRKHAVDDTGQISCHRLHSFDPTSESSP
jgi:hypothetical protein